MTRITIILFAIVVLMAITGCADKKKLVKPAPNIYDGSISKILGCMFAPASCSQEKNNQEKQITKEFDELDAESKSK